MVRLLENHSKKRRKPSVLLNKSTITFLIVGIIAFIVISSHHKWILNDSQIAAFQSLESDIPKELWCFWTGTNNMSKNRRACFNTMSNSQLKVMLITPENLSQFILPEAPLHEAYQYLSETHKSDYLRTYFMHFYGGGHSSIKKTTESWIPAFIELLNNPDKLANGYHELRKKDVADVPDEQLRKTLKRNWKSMLGNDCYIFRPRTSFTNEWYSALIKLMDSKLEMLRLYPSRYPQEVYTPEYPYPLGWTEMLGEIFHPIAYKYRQHVLFTVPRFKTSKHR